jgi:hypothetical protein
MIDWVGRPADLLRLLVLQLLLWPSFCHGCPELLPTIATPSSRQFASPSHGYPFVGLLSPPLAKWVHHWVISSLLPAWSPLAQPSRRGKWKVYDLVLRQLFEEGSNGYVIFRWHCGSPILGCLVGDSLSSSKLPFGQQGNLNSQQGMTDSSTKYFPFIIYSLHR